MFKILRKEEWSPNVYAMDIEAPRVAKKAQAGQFIVLRINEEGERIPLTIADYDRETGKILIVFQAIGASTPPSRRVTPSSISSGRSAARRKLPSSTARWSLSAAASASRRRTRLRAR